MALPATARIPNPPSKVQSCGHCFANLLKASVMTPEGSCAVKAGNLVFVLLHVLNVNVSVALVGVHFDLLSQPTLDCTELRA